MLRMAIVYVLLSNPISEIKRIAAGDKLSGGSNNGIIIPYFGSTPYPNHTAIYYTSKIMSPQNAVITGKLPSIKWAIFVSVFG